MSNIKGCSLDMIPVYKDMIFDIQQKAVIQLSQLESPYYQSDSDTQIHISEMYNKKIAENDIFFDICNKWREQSPNTDQLLSIAQMERNVHALDLIYKEILHLLSKLSENKIVRQSFPSETVQHLDNFESILDSFTKFKDI